MAATLLLPGAPVPEGSQPGPASPLDADLPLQCGNFSPLPPDCSACCNIWRNYSKLSTDLLLFIGEMTVTITGQTTRNEIVWVCWSILLPANPLNDSDLLGHCSNPTFPKGSPPVWPERVGLLCDTKATSGPLPAGLAVVGPLGSFECTVDTDPSG